MAQIFDIPTDSSVKALAQDATVQGIVEALKAQTKVNERMANANERLAWIEGIKDNPLAVLDGTKKTYDAVMRQWFLANGAMSADAAALTKLCDQWYTLTRAEWDGWVDFNQHDVSAVSTGVKGGDNAGLVLEMSTDTVAGRDDYAGLPLFACVDCNWKLDANGEVQITAIEGITPNFKRYDKDTFVGVLQQSGFYYMEETVLAIRKGVSSVNNGHKTIEPMSEAVRLDSSMRPWVCHAKYPSGQNGSKLTSCAGTMPWAWKSHDNSISYARNIGAKYSGECACDLSFIEAMFTLMTASLTADGILQGCCSNDSRVDAVVAESGTHRILAPASTTAFEEGMGVLIGTNASTDRNAASSYSISGQIGRIVTKVESVTISGTAYKAIYVDGAAFDATTSTRMFTFHWPCGTNDKIKGNNGSIKSCTSGKYPATIQGIECMVGGYEALSDSILNLFADGSVYKYELYLTNDATKQGGTLSNHYATGLRFEQPASAAWCYIKKKGFAKGVTFPTIITGAGSSTYYRDPIYALAATTGLREFLAVGNLADGAAVAGLSCVSGFSALSDTYWTLLARLSPNGNRGELAA